MLQSKNLDDQSFEEIMEDMRGRLPFLSPQWTDHNAHDPGITLIELIAWYKEMQQYHLNVFSPAIARSLLKLVGAKPLPPKAARCQIELPPRSYLHGLSPLETAEGIRLELLYGCTSGATLSAVYLRTEKGMTNVTGLLEQDDIAITPFAENGQMLLAFEEICGDSLRLWVEIEDKYPVKRNPFLEGSPNPRKIKWEFTGHGPIEPLQDETYALSQSGYIVFAPPNGWAESTPAPDGAARFLLSASQTYGGCEEPVRIHNIRANRHEAVQQQTLSKLTAFMMEAEGVVNIARIGTLDWEGESFAFRRTAAGLENTEILRKEDGRWQVEMTGAALDEEDNLFVCSADSLRWPELFYDSTGLPGMELQLPLGGQQILTDQLILICDTREADGAIRPAIWSHTDDLCGCGPRDRCFTTEGERILFGNGEHGAIPPAGERAILLAQLILSHCDGGNIPAGRLTLLENGSAVCNTAATGGSAAESISAATERLQSRLSASHKCTTTEDYEFEALHTSGLRVAAARAIPGYDPDEPTGKSTIPVVTVVVAPYSGAARPMPDEQFLTQVKKRLACVRPICTRVKVVPPRYVPLGLSISIDSSQAPPEAETLHEAAEEYFALSGKRRIGDPVVKNDLMEQLMAVEGVYKINKLELRPMGADCTVTPAGDVRLPQSAVAYLATMELHIK